jgi:hypothetical protein
MHCIMFCCWVPLFWTLLGIKELQYHLQLRSTWLKTCRLKLNRNTSAGPLVVTSLTPVKCRSQKHDHITYLQSCGFYIMNNVTVKLYAFQEYSKWLNFVLWLDLANYRNTVKNNANPVICGIYEKYFNKHMSVNYLIKSHRYIKMIVPEKQYTKCLD